MYTTLKPYRTGTCKCCGRQGKIRSGLCFQGSGNCYDLRKKERSAEKPLSHLLEQAEYLVHAWVRQRDSRNGRFICISCGNELPVTQMHAGHYLSAGNNSPVRFHADNIHGQCIDCNCSKHGNKSLYRISLIQKIGLAKVEDLEQLARIPYKWDRFELNEIINQYRAAGKTIKANHGL